MPYGDESNVKFLFKADGEPEWNEMWKIIDITCETDSINRNQSHSFSFKVDDIVYQMAKYSMNNWRKMHGLPMIRKLRKK